MRKQGKQLLGLVLLLVLVSGACLAVRNHLGYQYKKWHQDEYVKYEYTCTDGVKVTGILSGGINPLLKKEGLQQLSSPGVRVCAHEDADTYRVIVMTSDCTADRCDNAAVVMINATENSQTARTIAKYPTSEMYGSSILGSLDAWTSRSVTFKVNGPAPDGPCMDEVLKETYMYQVVTLDLESGKSKVNETCWQRSCTDQTIVCK